MSKKIMLLGTGSSVGKSLLTTALCRIFMRDGYKVAPFKSQNMALNSFITKDGGEMGRAQVAQAEAAGVEPSVLMNPVLLKPTGDTGSQVIVMGKAMGNMSAADYHEYKPLLRGRIRRAFDELENAHDIIVIEGAGSPAEINLRENDIVNMGVAEMADSPCLLIGDIDRGGVFAALYGTVLLLSEEERARVKGLIINKFRGDIELLRPGLSELEALTGVPVLGVIPYFDVDIDDEDSLSPRLLDKQSGEVDIAVIKLDHIANFTDFIALERLASVRYVKTPGEFGEPDAVILPGTKNTLADLEALKANGLFASIRKFALGGGLTFGVCGGYQMLGKTLLDPGRLESSLLSADGLGLLDMRVAFAPDKTTRQTEAVVSASALGVAAGERLAGYEIHMGQSSFGPGALPYISVMRDDSYFIDGVMNEARNVFGTYLHGIFDNAAFARGFVNLIRAGKGLQEVEGFVSMQDYKETQYDLLAAHVREHLDIEKIYEIMDT